MIKNEQARVAVNEAIKVVGETIDEELQGILSTYRDSLLEANLSPSDVEERRHDVVANVTYLLDSLRVGLGQEVPLRLEVKYRLDAAALGEVLFGFDEVINFLSDGTLGDGRYNRYDRDQAKLASSQRKEYADKLGRLLLITRIHMMGMSGDKASKLMSLSRPTLGSLERQKLKPAGTYLGNVNVVRRWLLMFYEKLKEVRQEDDVLDIPEELKGLLSLDGSIHADKIGAIVKRIENDEYDSRLMWFIKKALLVANAPKRNLGINSIFQFDSSWYQRSGPVDADLKEFVLLWFKWQLK